MSKKVEHPHAGHRQRLKSKVKDFGLKALKEHEVLELLLTYAIPRKDTNELAHYLLDKFGTFSKVIDASRNQLLEVKGVGDETALFFNVLSNFIDVYNASIANEQYPLITNSEIGILYFRQRYRIEENEYMHILCLTKRGSIIDIATFKGVDDAEIELDLRDFLKYINGRNVHSIMIFHTHPKGNVKPSEEDIITTQRIMYLCDMVGIKLNDHIILNETAHYSIKKNEDWDGMLLKSKKLYLKIQNEK